MKHRRTKATDIQRSVKKDVWERDQHRCILCGSYDAAPNAHYIPRSRGGLGIVENIVTLCLGCHHDFDQTAARAAIKPIIAGYLAGKHPGWNEQDLYYKKGI